MNRFIEVVGSGRYTESVVEYRAYMTVEVNDARVETAVREVTALRTECIRRIRDAGITDQELREGGAEVARHWSHRGEGVEGHDARQRLLISCDDPQRLIRAVSCLDSLFDDPRYTLTIAMGNHLFRAASAAKRGAERAAFADAEVKARNLASAAGVTILAPLEVEECDASSSWNGMLGESRAGSMFGGLGGGGANDGDDPLFAASRSVVVRLRVRFATTPDT